jgi:hypothetical protein
VAVEVDMVWAASPGADSQRPGSHSATGQHRAQPRPYDFCDASRSFACLTWLDQGWIFAAMLDHPPRRRPRAGATRSQPIVSRIHPSTASSPSRDPGTTPVILQYCGMIVQLRRNESASERPLGSGLRAYRCALASSANHCCDDIALFSAAAPLCGYQLISLFPPRFCPSSQDGASRSALVLPPTPSNYPSPAKFALPVGGG